VKRNIVVAMLIGCALLAAAAGAIEYDRDGKPILPTNYREWVFLSSGIGMTYLGSAAAATNPRFENVFVNPEAYQSFRRTGTWPDKTVLILEIRASAAKVSINKDGRVQTNVVAVEAHVKDASHGGWAFYNFGNGGDQVGTLLPKSADCYSCHQQNGAVNTTFVQFYPTLADIAKAKGTFRESSTEKKNSETISKK
jgi:hypothetical protein